MYHVLLQGFTCLVSYALPLSNLALEWEWLSPSSATPKTRIFDFPLCGIVNTTFFFSEKHLLYCVQGDTLAVVSMSQRSTARNVAASLNQLGRRAFRLFRERRKDGKND